ncbi:MAG: hypothetical protein EON58_05345 [Alphaproteobacteria bacterium]|nr:MAG: hypothetical protein EON58_05345 [Alphaproteobacteria bacterium]
MRPEHSESYSAGLIFTPSLVPGLRLSVDYTRIDKTDELTILTAQEVLDLEESLPGRVVRGANLPDDPAGYAGVITQLDLTLFNTAKSKMEAVDLQLDYNHDFAEWGELQFYGIATVQNTLESQAVSTAPTVDKVGYSNGPLRWRGNVGLVWKKGAWNASINTQWYDDYRVYSAVETESNRDALILSQGSDRIDSQSYTDLSARYTFGSGGLDGLQISAGVRNVFNEAPPTIATSDSRGGYSTYGDPRGRSYVVSVKKSF